MHTKPVRYIVTPEGRLLLPSSCWEVTLEGDENTFNYAVKTDTVTYLDTIVRKGFGGRGLRLPEPPADFEYAIQYSDESGSVYRIHRVGSGESTRDLALELANAIRGMQVSQAGRRVDAHVLCRPVNAWRPLEESE